jgi:hypothetical protein
MNASLLLLSFAGPEVLIGSAVGVVVSWLLFFAGRQILRRRSQTDTDSQNPKAEPEGDVDVFVHGSRTERRLAPRRRGNSVEVLIVEQTGQPPLQGWIVDRSVGGLCLLVEKPFKEGAQVDVRPRNASDTTPWTPVEVRSCRGKNGEWELGCRFVRTPPWNVMMLFG